MLDCKTPQKTLEGIFKNAAVFSEGKCNRRHFQKNASKSHKCRHFTECLGSFWRHFSVCLLNIIWQLSKHHEISLQAPFKMPKTSLEGVLNQQLHSISVSHHTYVSHTLLSTQNNDRVKYTNSP
jgi:hypothetical protein